LKALAIAPDGSWLARDPIWVAHSDVPPIDQLGRPDRVADAVRLNGRKSPRQRRRDRAM